MLKPEAPVVGGEPNDKNQRLVQLVSNPKRSANQIAADPLPLALRKHAEWPELQQPLASVKRGIAENDMPKNLAAFVGDQRERWNRPFGRPNCVDHPRLGSPPKRCFSRCRDSRKVIRFLGPDNHAGNRTSVVTTQSRFLLRRLHLPGGQVFALTNRNAARHTLRPADTSFRREVERDARRELARQQPRLPMNQTNESSCRVGSHQGRTAMEHATTCGYQRHVRARAAMRKPAWVGPLLTFMVRRGSTVRVRQRA